MNLIITPTPTLHPASAPFVLSLTAGGKLTQINQKYIVSTLAIYIDSLERVNGKESKWPPDWETHGEELDIGA